MVRTDKKCGRKDGRRQNYIPPTSSVDKNNSSNQKSRNVMQQTMHSYVCGINFRSKSSLVLSDLHLHKIGVPEFDRNPFIKQKSKCDLMRILSELVLIPQTQEFIGCCLTFSDF